MMRENKFLFMAALGIILFLSFISGNNIRVYAIAPEKVAIHKSSREDASKGAHQKTEAHQKTSEETETPVVVEPWSYTEDFERREPGAWASYPLWQDNAYDPNFRVKEIVPGDPNLSIVQKVTPYTNVDNYLGAQKLLDMYLVPEAVISFRYYLKTNQEAESIKVRFAAGELGQLDVTIPNPVTNQWVEETVGFDDFVRENPSLPAKEKVRINALAFLAKVPNADPDMPIYLGLDDISFQGAREVAFLFNSPKMYKLPEFRPYIPKKHYHSKEKLRLSGHWPVGAERVTLEVVSFTDEKKSFHKAELRKKDDQWTLKPLILSFPEGLYLGKLKAYKGAACLSGTEFTIHITPAIKEIGGKHPRLLFDAEKKKWIDQRFREERFKPVHEDILRNAKIEREKIPVHSLVFDLDQFPEEDWLPTWAAWGSRIYHTASSLRWNAMAYAFHDDREAGEYVKEVLLNLAGWPNWTHPWQTKRGRFSEHRTGSWSHRVAEAYDLTYDLMTPEERTKIRKAIMNNIVEGAHRTYVYDDNVTSKTSNWLGMVLGGSLMNMAAIYGDGPETENLEPYFTGAMLKYYAFINRVTDSKDGAWGEGYNYNNYTFSNMAYSVPALNNVFNIDVTEPLVGTYNEFIWAGLIKAGQWFEYGDSHGELKPASNWAFLLNMRKEPRLGWYYNYLKKGPPESLSSRLKAPQNQVENSYHETFMDVLYETEDVPQVHPFEENPVKAFRQIGTTVFKSGWETDDFVFVMRTGPFYNHQHLDQGSFWLADQGKIFIEERHLKNSTYYDDPIYQSHLTQPIGHSTILVDGNHQSQRVGDPLHFAAGFEDYAFISHFLDGKEAAFSSGDIGRLYWGKISSMQRNVLYLKPRTLLMLDMVDPAEKDAEITLLYQTAALEDITAGQKASAISKEGMTLNIMHLSPSLVKARAVETPHYLKTLLNDRPLKREGMLTLSTRTNGELLVFANLLTSSSQEAAEPELSTRKGNGFISGLAAGKKFAFTTHPGQLYRLEDMETDALSLTWDQEQAFVAKATVFRRNGALLVESKIPMVFEISENCIKYEHPKGGKLTIGAPERPDSLWLNGISVKNFTYDSQEKTLEIQVPKGEGRIEIK